MAWKHAGKIIREKSEFDVIEHVISGWSPHQPRESEPRGQADDRGRIPERRQRPAHPKPRLRHK
jgi:hypothetical protein